MQHPGVKRVPNQLDLEEESANDPYPGTYPEVCGWRVSNRTYRRDPHTVERQASIIAKALADAGYLETDDES